MKKLTKKNYFDADMQMKYMSVSQFKAFEKCSEAAMAELEGRYKREKTTALLVGSYVDAYFEGSLDRFKEENSEIFKRDGTLKSDYIQAEQIIARAKADELFKSFMSGQKQKVMTGVIEGVAVKIKIDSYITPAKGAAIMKKFPEATHGISLAGGAIVDLKIMRDFEPIYLPEQGRLPWFEAWRYDLQGAVYQEIVRQHTGARLPFFLAAVTKEREPDIALIQIEQDLLDFELEKFKENVCVYDAIKRGIIEPERCEKCDWCKKTKVLNRIVGSGEISYE